jgi:hypothetical protein
MNPTQQRPAAAEGVIFKRARTYAVTPLCEAGRVYLSKDAPWLADFLDEHSSFDKAVHPIGETWQVSGAWYLGSMYSPLRQAREERQSISESKAGGGQFTVER